MRRFSGLTFVLILTKLVGLGWAAGSAPVPVAVVTVGQASPPAPSEARYVPALNEPSFIEDKVPQPGAMPLDPATRPASPEWMLAPVSPAVAEEGPGVQPGQDKSPAPAGDGRVAQEPPPDVPPPPAPGGLLAPATVLLPMDDPYYVGASFLPRVTARYQTEDGIGYERGFWTLEGFVPYQSSQQALEFVDIRAILNNDTMFGINAGAGYRFYDADRNRIWGINSYYDYRDTGTAGFNQLGLGFESLGQYIDVRSNLYFVLGTQCRTQDTVVSSSAGTLVCTPTNVHFAGNNIFFDSMQSLMTTQTIKHHLEAAMCGWDLEVGGPIPYTRGNRSRPE